MSNSVRPHRWQPIRLLCPWDSPGKNTGVGCHFVLQCMKVKSESEVAQLCPTLVTPWTEAHQAPPSMGFSRESTRLGCHCFLHCGGREMHQIVHSLLGKTQKPRREDGNMLCLVSFRFQPFLYLSNLEADFEGSGHVFPEYIFLGLKGS